MKTIILISFSLILFISCTVQKKETASQYYVINAFDNTSINGFNLISIKDVSNNKYILISKRFGSGVDKPPFQSYDSIRVGEKYKIEIFKSDITGLSYTDNTLISKDIYFEFDSIIVMHNEKVLVPLYTSEYVFDKFIRK